MTTAAKKEQLMNRKGSKKTAFIYLAPAMVVILIFLYLHSIAKLYEQFI